MKIPELVAPAGNLEKCEIALHFGADAVYFGLKELNLRAGAHNFSPNEAREAISLVRRKGKKAYLTLNAFLFNHDLSTVEKMLSVTQDIKPDAMIISDPALIEMAREKCPEIRLHLSTQMNVTNWRAVKFWHDQGIQRIVLARELDLNSIREIKNRVPECEIEVFVHGAMCLAYSGRCLLSALLTGRNANKGDCTQPCRWKYRIKEISSGKEDIVIEEDVSGTSLLSSKDLCLFDYIPELVDAGINTFKIEGRAKSAYYTGIVTRSYRKVLDACAQGSKTSPIPTNQSLYTSISSFPEFDKVSIWRNELYKVSHREYTTGFTFPSDEPLQTYCDESYIRETRFLGIVLAREGATNHVAVRDRMSVGQEIEIVGPETNRKAVVKQILKEDGTTIEEAHPNQEVVLHLSHPAEPFSLLRCRIE